MNINDILSQINTNLDNANTTIKIALRSIEEAKSISAKANEELDQAIQHLRQAAMTLSIVAHKKKPKLEVVK